MSLFMAGAAFWWSSCVTFHGRCSILVEFMCHFSWQVQHFGEVHVSLFMAGAAFWWSSCVTFHGRCSILVKFMCHFFMAGAAFGEVHAPTTKPKKQRTRGESSPQPWLPTHACIEFLYPCADGPMPHPLGCWSLSLFWAFLGL